MSEHRAYEIIEPTDAAAPFLFTCEHASNALPRGMTANAGDRVLLEDHWGWDIGAGDVTVRLAERFGAPAVLATFSRLVADANRTTANPTFALTEIDGHPVSFNAGMTRQERMRRAALFSSPYHDAIGSVGRIRQLQPEPFSVVSIHSFTPLYRGTRRLLEVGVLFDEHEEPAIVLADALREQGLQTELNQPYSGRGDGALIYSAQRHGHDLGVEFLELEIRQDLIATRDGATDVADRIAEALKALVL